MKTVRALAVCGVAVWFGLGSWSAAHGGELNGLAGLDFREVIKSAKSKVFPAVVFIKCIRESYEEGKKSSQQVSGSGVIISSEGDVLTNWHVVDKAEEIRCLLYSGLALTAKTVGSDKDTDLALLRLQLPAGAEPVPRAALGDSDRLKEGDFVMAMGAPWGMARSVSIGIISCTGRFLPKCSEYSLWLQTDASICPGNSGGPLVNTEGEVIGITTLGALWGGDLGFAVPANTIRVIVAQLREFGRMNWSWTGLQLQALRDFERNIYFDAGDGVIVAGTDPDSPARRAGLEAKDRITRVNGQPVRALTEEDLPALRRQLGLLPKDVVAKVEIVRAGETRTLELIPREKGKVEGEDYDCTRWDMTVKTVNQFENPELYFHCPHGVFIKSIKWQGNAAEAGLRVNDIIIKIDGKEMTSLDDIRTFHQASLKALDTKYRFVFTVLRNGLQKQVVLDASRDYERR